MFMIIDHVVGAIAAVGRPVLRTSYLMSLNAFKSILHSLAVT